MSDDTRRSFLRSQYVQYENVNHPDRLGKFQSANIVLSGKVGGSSGAGSIFFEVETEIATKIGFRIIEQNPREDQYVYISLLDSLGESVPLGDDGFANSHGRFPTDPARSVEVGYVDFGYWIPGYEEPTSELVEIPGRSLSGTREESIAAFALGSPKAPNMPAGKYIFMVSGTEWQQVPYLVQIVVNPRAALSGITDLQLWPRGRLSRIYLNGLADLELAPRGALKSEWDLAGSAKLELKPRSVVTREVPFD